MPDLGGRTATIVRANDVVRAVAKASFDCAEFAMQCYEKATRRSVEIPDSRLQPRILGTAIGLTLATLHVPKAGCKAHALGPCFPFY